ncbi:hypothetical protein Agub_g5931 [Astrephomene gubernaculifera]|uniref:Uncharacterized protein n=1 Tax=Astrephomene gubernaculifera TaxID=47775 RepID=A0AAD3DPN9_9CHLO|nr:hypothetical protein Agub_g5931 [Astrephomene gubernaculifera]
MTTLSEDASCSLEDSEDLDDVPLSMARNGRYEQEEPPLSTRGPPLGFARMGAGFQLKLPTQKANDQETSEPDGLHAMRSEPAFLPETSRGRPPGLSLPLGQARPASASFSEEAAPLRTRRAPSKPPMLNLANPASASPVPSCAPTPALGPSREAASRAHSTAHAASGPQQQPVRVELVSSAFVLQNDQDHDASEASTSDRITQRCSRQLGIAPCDLQFFELRRLDDGVIPDSCTHVGVMIRGSTFSLSAIEDMLARSKRDDQLTTMLDRALREGAEHKAEARLNAEKLAKQSEELAVLRERLRSYEASNQHLREQLQRSDEHRQLLGGTIRTIKKEFEDFRSRVVVEGASVDQLPLHQLSLGPGPATSRASSAPAGAATER